MTLDLMGSSDTVRKEKLRLAMVGKLLADAPQRFGVGKHRVALSEQQEARLQGLSQAVASMVRQLRSKGWFEFARRELARGHNPVGQNKRDAWMQVLCEGLLQGGISRRGLCVAYEEKLRMTPGSAKVRVSKAVAVFLEGGLLRETSGRLVFVQAPSENQEGT